MFATAAPLTAVPAAQQTTPFVQHVDCAVGAHLGPLGACVLGTDDTPARRRPRSSSIAPPMFLCLRDVRPSR